MSDSLIISITIDTTLIHNRNLDNPLLILPFIVSLPHQLEGNIDNSIASGIFFRKS